MKDDRMYTTCTYCGGEVLFINGGSCPRGCYEKGKKAPKYALKVKINDKYTVVQNHDGSVEHLDTEKSGEIVQEMD